MDPNAHLRQELLLDAVAQCQGIGATPDAVLVSGDVAFAGAPEEYEYAISWLDKLCRDCGTTLSAVFVIPGNHDVIRSIASRPLVQVLHRDIKNASEGALDGLLRGLLSDEEASRLLYEALGSYNNFASQFFCDLLPPNRTIAKRDIHLNDRSILRMSGINSAFVSSAADVEKSLFIDPSSFQLIREHGVEHLVICHHPYAWLKQGEAFEDFLGSAARIHLFGHVHTNRILTGRDWVRIAASAAHPDRTEPGWEPGYNLIEVKVEGTGPNRFLEIDAHVRVWQQRPGIFRAKVDRNGAAVFKQRIKLDPWTPPPPEVLPKMDGETNTVAVEQQGTVQKPATRSDPMDPLRDIKVRFYKLTLSQKSAIAGKLNLLEEEDSNQPDFERFRRAFLRARDRGQVNDLKQAVEEAVGKGR